MEVMVLSSRESGARTQKLFRSVSSRKSSPCFKGASLGGESLVAGGLPLLADQVGFPAGELLVFIAVGTASVRTAAMV